MKRQSDVDTRRNTHNLVANLSFTTDSGYVQLTESETYTSDKNWVIKKEV